jgi:hypothetical protein
VTGWSEGEERDQGKLKTVMVQERNKRRTERNTQCWPRKEKEDGTTNQRSKAVNAQALGTGQGQLIREVLIDFNVKIDGYYFVQQ